MAKTTTKEKLSSAQFVAKLSKLCSNAVRSGLDPVPLINQFVKVHMAATNLGYQEGFLMGILKVSEDREAAGRAESPQPLPSCPPSPASEPAPTLPSLTDRLVRD